MSLKYTVPHNKQIRVIIDTDAACEADDPFAIVQALLSPKLVVQFRRIGNLQESISCIIIRHGRYEFA